MMSMADEVRRLAMWVLLGIMVVACGRPPASVPAPAATIVLPRDMAGCYDLRPTRSLYYAPPRIYLQASPAPEPLRQLVSDSAWALIRLDQNGRPITEDRQLPFLYWTKFPPDSIRVVITTGYSGSQLIVPVQPGANTLRGRAVRVWDSGPPTDARGSPVVLIRVPCILESEQTSG